MIKIAGGYINIMNRIWPAVGKRHGYYLFSYPFKAKLTDKQQAFLSTAKRTNIQVDGHDIPLYQWGNGPKTCLFVHGWQSNTYRWKTYIDTLDKSQWTIYAIDAPGHGNAASKYGNVSLFGRAIEAVDAHLPSIDAMIGHSVGAFSILFFGHIHPDRQPSKMVILGSPGRAMDFVDMYANIVGLSDHARANIIDYFTQRTGYDPHYFHIDNFIKNISSQGLIIHDEEDKEAPPHYAKRIHAGWKTSELWMTKGWGHKLRNRAVIDRVINFLS